MATKIKGRQIENNEITKDHIKAGAGIETSKLQEGPDFVKRDGSVPFTGNVNANSNKVVNVGTPTANNDAANKAYVDQQISSLNSIFDSKGSCKAGTTGNINIANPGTATFDGVTLTIGDRLLVRAQSEATENGIYIFNGSANPLTRAADMDVWNEVPGAVITVEEGSTLADTTWLCTSNSGGTMGTTPITWQQTNAAGLTNANFIDKEVPSGTKNGVNTSFVLANTPVANSEHVYVNGLLQEPGAGNDYTITGATITMLVAPETGDVIRVSYRR